MGGRGHPSVKNRFHKLRRISLARCDGKRSYLFCDALSACGGVPAVVFYAEQPLLSKELDNGSVNTLCRFRKSAVGIGVEIPVRLRLT